MNNSFPQIDIVPDLNRHELAPKPWYKSRRLLIFSFSFLLSACVSLAYVYSRPALYRSYATLLTVAQTAIDQKSTEADIQHVAIQRQILTGQELLEKTLERLNRHLINTDTQLSATDLTPSELRRLLTVEAVPETNLVELAAIGFQAEILVPLINTWIDVYLESRADEIRQTTGLTIEKLQEELSGLNNQILMKRSELERFRESNGITSLGRENLFENQSLARFKGLNKSFNDASENAIKTKARLNAVRNDISAGKVVVPDEDKRGMNVLEMRLQKLRQQLAAFDKKYTRNYLAMNPSLNVIPGQIKELEKEIQIKRNYGKGIALTDAEQNYEAARESLYGIKKQLDEHKRTATEFSSRFAEHEALLSDVEGLELLQRTTQERLAQIEAKQAEKFPQVKVIERAFLPREPFSPDYTRDALIAIVSSIIFGLFCVWIFEFLTRKEGQNASITISGINMNNGATPDLLKSYQQGNEQLTQNSAQSLQYEQSNALESDSYRELSDEDLSLLLEASDIKAKQLIALLLSGLMLDEIRKLRREHIDFEQEVITIRGDNQRIIPINQALRALFEHIEPCPTWDKNKEVSITTLEAILVYAAVDSGLTEPQEITAACISNAYILYLVKQGIRLSEIEQITGYIDPTELSKYSRYSPEKRGLPISDINRLHPVLDVYTD